jgi:RimJ/RimL family protein N-acetyltransferase
VRIPLPIETARLAIRAFDPEADGDAMVAVYCDPDVMRFIPGGALDGIQAVKAELTRHAAAHESRGFGSWAVVEREESRVIGDVGLGIFEPTGDVELGYTFARELWGHGYATEAASACLAAGLEHLSAPRIVVVVDGENERSLLVARRLGLEVVDVIEAYGRPHVMFAHDR